MDNRQIQESNNLMKDRLVSEHLGSIHLNSHFYSPTSIVHQYSLPWKPFRSVSSGIEVDQEAPAKGVTNGNRLWWRNIYINIYQFFKKRFLSNQKCRSRCHQCEYPT